MTKSACHGIIKVYHLLDMQHRSMQMDRRGMMHKALDCLTCRLALACWRGIGAGEELVAQRGQGIPKGVVLRAPQLPAAVPAKLLHATQGASVEALVYTLNL